MKTKSLVLALMLICAAAALVGGAPRADEVDKKPGDGPDAAARAVAVLAEANTLAEFGKKNKSAFALVTAGGLLLRLDGLEERMTDHDATTEVEFDEDAETKEQPKMLAFKKQAGVLFDEARAVGASDADVEKLIKLVKPLKSGDLILGLELPRGAKGGPKTIRKTLPIKATHSTKIPFEIGKKAVVTFRSNGICHVSIVRTDNAYVHEAGDTTSSNAVWVPAPNAAPHKGPAKGPTKGKGRPPAPAPAHKAGGTHTYIIKVRNLDKKAVQYTVVTN
jgi:hypothetical protein